MANFLHPVFTVSHVQHTSGLHAKFAVCGSMVDIHSATGENRRRKKEERRRRNHRSIT